MFLTWSCTDSTPLHGFGCSSAEMFLWPFASIAQNTLFHCKICPSSWGEWYRATNLGPYGPFVYITDKTDLFPAPHNILYCFWVHDLYSLFLKNQSCISKILDFISVNYVMCVNRSDNGFVIDCFTLYFVDLTTVNKLPT